KPDCVECPHNIDLQHRDKRVQLVRPSLAEYSLRPFDPRTGNNTAEATEFPSRDVDGILNLGFGSHVSRDESDIRRDVGWRIQIGDDHMGARVCKHLYAGRAKPG